jgi:hypothetical protein
MNARPAKRAEYCLFASLAIFAFHNMNTTHGDA